MLWSCSGILVTYGCKTKHPKCVGLKQQNHLSSLVGWEFGSSLAAWFWHRASHEVAVRWKLGLQSAEGLIETPLFFPSWFTCKAEKLMWLLIGGLSSSSGGCLLMTWQLASPDREIQESKAEVAMPFIMSPCNFVISALSGQF